MKQITCPHCGDTYPDFDVAHVCSKGPYAPKLKSKMNERIKELLEQAGCKVMDDGDWYIPSATGLEKIVYTKGIGLEKFAELIVKECSNYIGNKAMLAGGACTIVGEEGLWLSKDLLEHFGVEK